MSYQHQNRFHAHANVKALSAVQKLVGSYVSSQIRSETNTFSISHRRLAEVLGISKNSVRLALNKLEAMGYLTAQKSPVSVYADTYTLTINCPLNCLEWSIHNTEAEKKLNPRIQTGGPNLGAGGPNLGQGGPMVGTHINKYKEIEILETKQVFVGQDELGILLELIAVTNGLTPEQIKVSQLVTQYPEEMALALSKLIQENKVTSPQAYLKSMFIKTPANLIRLLELKTASETANNLITSARSKTSPEASNSPSDYKPISTSRRLLEWLKQIDKEGLVPEAFWDDLGGSCDMQGDPLFSYYITDLANTGKLTSRHLVFDSYANAFIAGALGFKADNPIRVIGRNSHGNADINMHANPETGYPELQVHRPLDRAYGLQGLVGNTELVYQTLDEKAYLVALNEAMTKARAEFLIFRPEATEQEWARSEQRGKVFASYPDPLTPEQKAERYLQIVNEKIADLFRDLERREQPEVEAKYSDYLRAFTIKDDMGILLEYIPARPEGHGKHLRAFEKAYLEAVAKHPFLWLRVKLRDFDYPSDPKWLKTPDKYLLEVIAEDENQDKWWERAI